ncbi:hypothetical protein [Paraburkholderia fungorum]|jgi:acyl-CoA synthetase (AMP-forming)/AMP-acid ligase II|uniref:hypothetical protein n=1 Tax=Paraburkholderia fungorum TaxID=134537 RepID=UPI000DB008AC|nr:hypothetical protein [Paraburkholderia fungorum]PZR46372.1 MAG: hypothetical protein DI523_17730 [Paraburkholderia fungorum]
MTYATLRERIARLASGLSEPGVQHGSTVAALDWDSHRAARCRKSLPKGAGAGHRRVMGISQGLNGAEVIGNPQTTKRFFL